MLVKLIPAELITTDVMRMTLETGTGVDDATSAFSFSEVLSTKDGVAVAVVEEGVAEGESVV